jgi:hypothetical protein
MFGARRNRPRLAVLLIGLIALAGCTTSRFGPTDGGPSVAAPVKGAAAKFAFAPVDGVPVPVLQAMSTALNQEAVARKLSVVPNTDPAAVYIVRGYLSAVADGTKARLVFVWDVVDKQGARLHRVTGQETGGAISGDPWTGIGLQTVNAVARKTIDSLANWVK